MKRTAQLARTGDRQNRLLAAACEQEAAQVRAALSRRRDAAARARILHADQLARMQRIMGAAMMHEMVGM